MMKEDDSNTNILKTFLSNKKYLLYNIMSVVSVIARKWLIPNLKIDIGKFILSAWRKRK
jgi:hypothetical protein